MCHSAVFVSVYRVMRGALLITASNVCKEWTIRCKVIVNSGRGGAGMWRGRLADVSVDWCWRCFHGPTFHGNKSAPTMKTATRARADLLAADAADAAVFVPVSSLSTDAHRLQPAAELLCIRERCRPKIDLQPVGCLYKHTGYKFQPCLLPMHSGRFCLLLSWR